jgi:hypothetical protein
MGFLIAAVALVGIFFLGSVVIHAFTQGWWSEAFAVMGWTMLCIFGGGGLLGLFFYGFLKIVGAA